MKIRTKWTAGASLMVAIGSLSAFWYFPHRVALEGNEALRQQGQSIAQVTAFAARTGLDFGDAQSVRAALAGALAVEETLWVRVVGNDTNRLDVTVRNPDDRTEVENFDTYVSAPVVKGGVILGMVHLGLSGEGLRGRIAQARLRVGLLCLGFLIAGALGAYWLTSIVTGPLSEIADTSREISQGDFSRRAPILADDEVGSLAASFNAMVDSVEQAQEELRQTNASLEARVQDGLRELRAEMDERHRVEESRLLLAAAVEQSQELLLVLDTEGVIEYANAAFAGSRESTVADMVGKTLLGNFNHGLEPQQVADIKRAISLGERWVGSVRLRTGDGETHVQRTTVSPVKIEDGSVQRLVVTGHDITREATLEDQLRQSQKMEAVGQLAGGIAHDFNNLLAAIKGYCELLLFSPLAESEDRESLDEISRAADRAAALTAQLLAFGRRQMLSPEALVPYEVVDELRSMLGRLITRGIQLRVQSAPDRTMIVVDRSQLEQIIINLVINARDAIGDSGRIEVRVDRVSSRDAPMDWEIDSPEVIRLRVQDDGCGIPKEDLDQIFEPFYTTKDLGKGTGLGLSTVYGIVQQSGGAIAVDSVEGEGTRFDVFFIPAHEGGISETTSGDSTGELGDPVDGSGPRILLAEDEPVVRKLVRRQLEREGFEVEEAADGEYAWDMLHESKRPFDLLLSDVRMPRLDGLSLAARVRDGFPEIPVLLMSGFAGTPDGAGGGTDVEILAKPFTRKELLAAVAATLLLV